LTQDAATVLAARFGVLLARWNGEVDGKIEGEVRLLNSLCRSIVQLQRGTLPSNRANFEQTTTPEAKIEHNALNPNDIEPEKNPKQPNSVKPIQGESR
jgi:hypothetical protein